MSRINLFDLKIVEEIKKYELENKKQPAEVVKEIYNEKGELGLTGIVSSLISYYIGGKLQKGYDIGDFEWCLDFLAESFKIFGAEEAAYLVKKDEEKWIHSWLGKYWPEIAKRNNVPKVDVQLIYKTKIETKRETKIDNVVDNKIYDPFYFLVIEELKKYEVEDKKQPAEVAREIYNNKGEIGLVDLISKVIIYYMAGQLNKRYDIGDFEWCLDFLAESFKIFGAEEAAYLVKKDEEKWIHSWLGKYWPEIAKRNNLPPMNLYRYKIENNQEKLEVDEDNIN